MGARRASASCTATTCVARRGYLAGDDDAARRRARGARRRSARRRDRVCARRLRLRRASSTGSTPAAFRAARKPLVGYSDVTALLLWQRRCAGLVGFHGPMLERGSDVDPGARARSSPRSRGERARPRRCAGRARRRRRGDGRLVGGNLALVAASLGTPWEVDTRGAILLSRRWASSRTGSTACSSSCARAGKLARLAGVGVGASSGCEDERYPEPARRGRGRGDRCARCASRSCAGLPFGHVRATTARGRSARALRSTAARRRSRCSSRG